MSLSRKSVVFTAASGRLERAGAAGDERVERALEEGGLGRALRGERLLAALARGARGAGAVHGVVLLVAGAEVGHGEVVEEPLLRRRIVYGTLGFAGFTIMWTSLPFLLARAPYGYSETAIGLFSLLGAAGAVGASLAGTLHDAGRKRNETRLA